MFLRAVPAKRIGLLVGSSRTQVTFQLSLVYSVRYYLYKNFVAVTSYFLCPYYFMPLKKNSLYCDFRQYREGREGCVPFAIFNWKLLFPETFLWDSIPDESFLFLNSQSTCCLCTLILHSYTLQVFLRFRAWGSASRSSLLWQNIKLSLTIFRFSGSRDFILSNQILKIVRLGFDKLHIGMWQFP